MINQIQVQKLNFDKPIFKLNAWNPQKVFEKTSKLPSAS